LLRHGFSVNPVGTDLNALVTAALAQIQGDPDVEVVSRLQPLPRIPADPDQFPKVLTNLLLNAREAVGPGGRIEVRTTPQDGYAVVSVADNGCGMSAEFVRRRLFRPFQTTKQKGLGIGLFQSRMIAEAHGGRIEVESEPGRGTTFRVLLPLAPEPSDSRSAAVSG
jgi:signal transduction histidine kinase